MTETSTKWGGKRQGSGRKPKREGCKKMETYLTPELKAKAADKAKSLGLSQSEYLRSIIIEDLSN